MADLKFSKVKLSLDGKQVELSLDQIRKKAEQTATAMKGMKPDSAEWKQARKNLEALHAAEEDLIPTLERVNHYMKEMAHTATTDLGKATRELTKLRDAMPGDHKDLAKINGFIEKFKDWMKQNREMGMTLEKVKAQLSDLVNTPTAKLEQGLAAINKELATNAELSESDRAGLKGMSRQYEAQLAVNQYGKAGSAPMQTMTDEQLRAEQSRLRNLYMSTQGATGFDGISKDALDRLQKANQLIKDRAEAEREAAKAAKEADEEAQRRIEFAQQGQRTHQTLANMEKASYEDLEAALKHLQEQYKTYASGDVKHIQRNLAAQDQLKQRMKDMQSLLLTEQELSDRVNNKKKYSIVQLQQAYDQLKAKLSNLAVGETEAIEKTQKQMKSLQKEISKAKGELTGFAKLWNTALKNIGAYMGVFAAFGYARNLIKGMVTESLSLSDAFAQVQKVTGFSAEEVKKLNDNLSKLDTRTSLAQLNELAFTAGKMGLGKYQLEGVQGFVKAANELQVALGEDLGSSVEEAILPLAKLGENLGLFEKLGVEKAMKSIGSSINELSQTTTAAGSNIVDFARRIQPSAQMVGLTADEILALGSAADSFGLHAEVAATSFTKFLVNYRTNTEAIEQALGITKGTLDEMFARGDTMQGLMLIFQRMHDLGDLRVLAPIFKELGSEGSRMSETFGSFAVNIDQLREHLATSTKAFDEATSVTREYNLVQETAQGIMERSTNIWKNAFVNPEGVDMVKQLADEWYRLSRELTESTTWMTAAKNSLGLILEAVKLLIEALPTLIRLMMFYGVGNVLQNLILNFNNIYRAVILAGNGVQRFNLLLKTNAIAIGVTLLGYVVSKFIDMSAAADKATESVEENTAAMERNKRATQTYTSTMASNYATLMEKYDQLKRQWKALKTEHEKNEWIKKNKSAFEELGLSVTNAASAEDVFEKNTARVVEGFKRRAEAAALAAQMTELYRQQMDIQGEAQKKINEKGVSEGDRVLSNPTGRYERDRNANTFNNGQYTLGNDGSYHYTEKGAEEYNRQLVNGYITEYESIEKKIDDAAKRMEELGKTPATTNVTPRGGDKGGKNTTEQKAKEVREQYDAAKERATGVIAKIDELYNLQVAAMRDAQSMGQLSEQEANDLVKMMEKARNESLMRARKAVGSGEEEAIAEWEKWAKEMMPKLVADSSKWSDDLYKAILDVNIKDLYDFLKKFDGNNIAGIDSKAFLDSIMKKGAENKKKSEIISAQFKVRTDKFLDQYEVIRLAHKKMINDMQSLGLMTETYEEMAKRIAEGKDRQPKTLANGRTITDDEAYSQMGTKFIGQGLVPYSINIENKEEAQKWIHDFATNSKGELEDFAQAFPQIMEWLKLIEEQKKAIAEGDMIGAQKAADELEAAMPTIQAMFYQLEANANSVGATIKKQVEAMTSRTPIGIDEMRTQSETRVSMTESRYDKQIGKANDMGDAASAAELERQKQQAIFDIKEEYRQKEYQIREQMGATWYEQYENEVAVYKNMLNKKLISEKEYQKKKRELDINLGLKNAQFYNGLMSSMVDALQEYEISAVEAKYDVLIAEAKKNGQDTTDLENKKEEEKLNVQKKYADLQFAVKASEIIANTAVAIMQAYAQLGPIGGSVAAALMSATGALQLMIANKEREKIKNMTAGTAASSSTSTSSTSSSSATSKLRLGKGMLTYEEGNVHKYLGQDGRVYTATEEPEPKDGLITHPIATTVQGQAALVAEKGPEIVLGRKTTRAIMMNEPELIRYLANYQQHGGKYDPRRLYDSGTLPATQPSDISPQTSDNEALMQRLDKSDELMASVLFYLQHPVRPKIEMFSNGGEDGMYESMQKATSFMRRYGK